MSYKFSLGNNVTIVCSGEHGEVIGRAEYSTQSPHYWVRYKAADGRAQECWWSEDALLSQA